MSEFGFPAELKRHEFEKDTIRQIIYEDENNMKTLVIQHRCRDFNSDIDVDWITDDARTENVDFLSEDSILDFLSQSKNNIKKFIETENGK